MKKKLALLLATAMVMAVPAQVMAASTAALSGTGWASTITNKAVMYEHNYLSSKGITPGEFADVDKMSYALDGQDLIVTLDKGSGAYVGSAWFDVELGNASWFFKNGSVATPTNPTSWLSTINYIQPKADMSSTDAAMEIVSAAAVASVITKVNALVTSGTPSVEAIVTNFDNLGTGKFNTADYKLTYDLTKGRFVPLRDNLGTYYRYQTQDTRPGTTTLGQTQAIDSGSRGQINVYDLAASNWGDKAPIKYENGKFVYNTNTALGMALLAHDLKYDNANVTTGSVTNSTWTDMSNPYTGSGYTAGVGQPNAQQVNSMLMTYTTGSVLFSVDPVTFDPSLINWTNSLNNDYIVEIPYKLEVLESGNDKTARVTLLPIRDAFGNTLIDQYSVYGSAQKYQIRVPVVARATSEEATVSIPSNSGINVSMPAQLLGTASTGAMNIYALSTKTGRDRIALDTLVLKETRFGTIKDGGVIELKARTGYYFDSIDKVTVSLEKGLNWNGNGNIAQVVEGTKGITNDYTVSYKKDSAGNVDRSTVYVYIPKTRIARTTTTVIGAILIKELVITADYAAAFDDVYIDVNANIDAGTVTTDDQYNRNLAGSIGVLVSDIQKLNAGSAAVKVATRKDWTMIFETTTDPIPTLVTGRYSPYTTDSNGAINVEASQRNAGDEHKAATVKLSENAIDAWWASRETEFSLPEGAKFRKVVVNKLTEVTASGDFKEDGTIIANGVRSANYTLDAGRFTLYSLSITATKVSSITFTPYISIASNFAGDQVELTFSNTTSSTVSNESKQSIPIANVVKPIDVKVGEVIELKIGYQTLSTGNVIITETAPGRLQRGKEIKVSVTDYITQDLYFAPIDAGKDVTFTGGGGYFALRDIKNLDVSNNSITNSALLLGINSGTISLTVDRESVNEPAEITLSNLQVKVSRDVPQSTINYQVVVWGNAVAANYGTARDMFTVPGISTEYVKVVSSAIDSAVLTQEVRITIGEQYYLVEGKPVDLEAGAAAYVSADGATMVPLRFVSEAFGLTKDQILWDNNTKTATIIHPSRVLQFTAGSDRMLVSGSPVTMGLLGADGNYYAYKAEIPVDRMFIPFRAIGEAFGVSVTWEEATKTAIYNAK